jgi:hypothetical protein
LSLSRFFFELRANAVSTDGHQIAAQRRPTIRPFHAGRPIWGRGG